MEKEVRAIVLAAGKGTRMKSAKPKVLHEIFNKPLLGWVVEAIARLHTKTQSIVIIGHGAPTVEEYLNKNYKYVKTTLQKEQLGTGHAVAQALPLLHDFRGNVIITCGDTPLISTKTLRNLVRYHNENAADLTVMTTLFDNPYGYGRIIRNTKDEIIKIIEEKDANDTIKEIKEVNTGVYCLDWAKIRKAFTELKNNNVQGEYYLTDIIKWARDNAYKVLGFVNKDSDEIYGINSRQNLAYAAKLMKDRYNKQLMEHGVTIVDPESTYISPETTIDIDTTIYPNTYIEGKNTIAKNCKIGPMAHIRGNCEIGEGCKIGNFVEFKNTNFGDGSKCAHLTYVGDSDVGKNVNFGCGVVTVNYDGKNKFRTTIKDGAFIGSNVNLIAPVTIGENALLAAGSTITDDVEDGDMGIARNRQSNKEGYGTQYKNK